MESGGEERTGFGGVEGGEGVALNRKCDEDRKGKIRDVLSERGH